MPAAPYRGVARPNVCYAMELMIDAIARQIGKEPYEVRLANLVRPIRCRSTMSPTSISTAATIPRLLQMAVEAIGLPGDPRAAEARRAGRPPDRPRHVRVLEQTAHGTTADGKRRALYEQVFARITPDGRLDVRAGIQSIGQGLETTLAQIASECLGIDANNVQVKLGDTELSPYSSGAWGSRGIVWAGGATARACKELASRVAEIGAAMLQTDAKSVQVRDGGVFGPHRQRVARRYRACILLAPSDLPGDIDPHGLEVTGGYAPDALTGVHTGSAHATVVAVDTETGDVEILDYVVVEDAGILINPMIVDGQIHGGTAQGIGAALFEEMPFDAQGQPLASTLADYLLPGCRTFPRPHHPHGDTIALHGVRPERRRRRRRDRSRRCRRERSQRMRCIVSASKSAKFRSLHAASWRRCRRPGALPDMLQPFGAGAPTVPTDRAQRQNCRAG